MRPNLLYGDLDTVLLSNFKQARAAAAPPGHPPLDQPGPKTSAPATHTRQRSPPAA